MLTAEEKRFLRDHRIQLDQVYDGSGMTKPEYQQAMQGTKMIVVSGTAPCKKASHTLRTKSGHCFQCNPKVISFQKRSQSNAHVYIAGSVRGKYIKIGTAEDLDNRLRQLNDWAYGNARDWKMLASSFVKNAGRVENTVQTRLADFKVGGTYKREGKEQKCKELFRCNFEKACRVLHETSDKGLTLRCSSIEQATKHYSFK